MLIKNNNEKSFRILVNYIFSKGYTHLGSRESRNLIYFWVRFWQFPSFLSKTDFRKCHQYICFQWIHIIRFWLSIVLREICKICIFEKLSKYPKYFSKDDSKIALKSLKCKILWYSITFAGGYSEKSHINKWTHNCFLEWKRAFAFACMVLKIIKVVGFYVVKLNLIIECEIQLFGNLEK